MFIEGTYFAYLLVSVSVTIWVARTLHQRGAAFLVEAFGGNKELAESVNHLLVVGFYLINVGYVTFTLHSSAEVLNLRAAMELFADKLGLVLLVLGGMHFFNIYVFSRFRKQAISRSHYPVAPDEFLPKGAYPSGPQGQE
jgi:hypothetical protein